MAWLREYNKGSKGVGEVWATAANRSDEAANLSWDSSKTWTPTVKQWTKALPGESINLPFTGWYSEYRQKEFPNVIALGNSYGLIYTGPNKLSHEVWRDYWPNLTYVQSTDAMQASKVAIWTGSEWVGSLTELLNFRDPFYPRFGEHGTEHYWSQGYNFKLSAPMYNVPYLSHPWHKEWPVTELLWTKEDASSGTEWDEGVIPDNNWLIPETNPD